MVNDQQELLKIFRRDEAARFLSSGVFEGSDDDRRDGYIHLCTEPQLARTLQKHFAGEHDLFVGTLKLTDGSATLRFEGEGPNGPFPHLYRPIELVDLNALIPLAALSVPLQLASD